MTESTNFLSQWHVLKNCPDLLKHRISKFAIRDGKPWLVNDQGRLLGFGKKDEGILAVGHGKSLVKVEALRDKTIVDMAFGFRFVVALTGDAQVWTWGTKNNDCVLGEWGRVDPFIPRLLCTDIVSIKCGEDHSLALSKSGQIWAWGSNEYGQIGNGSEVSCCELVLLNSLRTEVVTKIACGSFYSLALTQDGKLFAWGRIGSGRLGIGSTIVWTPEQVVSLPRESPIKDIACGYEHSLLLLENGLVYAMGSNEEGQLVCPHKETSQVPVKVKVKTKHKFELIVCSANFSAAMTSSGRVFVWGRVNDVRLAKMMRTPCKSFSQALLFFNSNTETPRNMLLDNIEPVNPLHAQLAAKLNDSSTSDIEFVFPDRSIHAHRQYLMFTSSYLARMLSEHWEANKKQVAVTQYPYRTFYAYIRYLYTGLVSVMTTPELIDLLDLATAFMEESLRLECIKGLQGKLCIEHACTIYQAADHYELDDLKNAAIKFIRNNFEKVSATEGYAKLRLVTRENLIISVNQ